MSTYRKADEEDVALLARVVEGRHRALSDAGVTIELLVAHAPRDEDGEPKAGAAAVKAHGYPAYAVVSVNSQRNRVAGLADARIVLDGDKWPDHPEPLRVAILDHECEHLELRLEEADDETGQTARVMLDDCFRPKLKLQPHDAQVGIFWKVAERNGPASVEFQAIEEYGRQLKQLSFGWENVPAADGEPACVGAGAVRPPDATVSFNDKVFNFLKESLPEGTVVERVVSVPVGGQ